jgi:hypothetical protein
MVSLYRVFGNYERWVLEQNLVLFVLCPLYQDSSYVFYNNRSVLTYLGLLYLGLLYFKQSTINYQLLINFFIIPCHRTLIIKI